MSTAPVIDFERAVAVLDEHFEEVRAVLVYGSYADGTADSESDLDVAVLLPPGSVSTLDLLRVRLTLYGELRIDVDLVDLWSLRNFELANEIIRKHRVLICRDEAALEHWELRTLRLIEDDNIRYGAEREQAFERMLARGKALVRERD